MGTLDSSGQEGEGSPRKPVRHVVVDTDPLFGTLMIIVDPNHPDDEPFLQQVKLNGDILIQNNLVVNEALAANLDIPGLPVRESYSDADVLEWVRNEYTATNTDAELKSRYGVDTDTPRRDIRNRLDGDL